MSAPTRGATGDYSKGPSRLRGALSTLAPLALGLFAAAVVGSILLIVAEFSVINRITIGDNVPKETFRGFDRHHFALLVIGVAAIPMAWGGFIGRSRPAFGVLALLGLAALLIVMVADTPELNDKRGFDVFYDSVATHVGVGYFLETLGSVLVLVSGAVSYLFTSGAGRIRVRRGSDPDPPAKPAPTDPPAETAPSAPPATGGD
jgi:hypothetical protein